MAMIKTPEEIAIMKRAARATEAAIKRALPYIKPGVTERQVAEKMEAYALKIKGVTGLAYPPIIASGPNGAQPHAGLTDRVLCIGDFVTIDFGVTLDGYASDITRTFVLGKPTRRQSKIYRIVLRAQTAGVAAAKAGMACTALDAVCRGVIEREGFGEYFLHTTGHGVGTEVHEDPRLAKNSEAVLETGMVVTIEPGIYIEGFGGVRIEDTVLITEDGCEVLTPKIPKELIDLAA